MSDTPPVQTATAPSVAPPAPPAPPRCIRYRRYREPLTERHVQAIWYDRDLRPDGLVTRRGSAVRVVHPGDWNLGAGPDFRNAVLEVGRDRTRLSGDVEVHLRPSDWTAHGHGDDPAYRNVVAHVTWSGGPVPPTLPPCAVSIWLGRFLAASPGFTPEQIDLEAYPFAKLPAADRPCRGVIRDNPDVAHAVLDAAGGYRIRAKARRLAALLAGADRLEVFYGELMTALGYKRNVRGFRYVADAVPYVAVKAEPENAAAAFRAAADFVEWDRTGIRPWNTPERRLAAAARLFVETPVMALADAFDFSREAVRDMVSQLAGGGIMGRGRAAAVIANVVLPFAIAEERVSTIPEWLPPEDVPQVVRLTASRLFGRDHNPAAFYATDGVRIQGLIQIHRDFCLQVHPDCEECRLVYDIRQSMPTPQPITVLPLPSAAATPAIDNEMEKPQ